MLPVGFALRLEGGRPWPWEQEFFPWLFHGKSRGGEMHHVWRIEVLEGVFLRGRKYALSEWTFFFFAI